MAAAGVIAAGVAVADGTGCCWELLLLLLAFWFAAVVAGAEGRGQSKLVAVSLLLLLVAVVVVAARQCGCVQSDAEEELCCGWLRALLMGAFTLCCVWGLVGRGGVATTHAHNDRLAGVFVQ